MLGIEPKFPGKPKPSETVEPKRPQAVFDIECYINCFIIAFKRLSDGETFSLMMTDEPGSKLDVSALVGIIRKYELISFNGNKFDVPLLRYAMTGADTAQLKAACDELIVEKLSEWKFVSKYRCPELAGLDHIDVMDVAPLKASLQTYAGRIPCPSLWDLPYPPETRLTPEQMENLRQYCINDLEDTQLLYEELSPQIELRRSLGIEYIQDLRSKGDPGIAEAVIKAEVTRLTKKRPASPKVTSPYFRYKVPEFIGFRSGGLRRLLDGLREHNFMIDKGKVSPPELFNRPVKLGHSTYSLGVGGLHSTESKAYHTADEEYGIADFDATSYYPAIILNCGFFPDHIGPQFLDVYRGIVDKRIAAKSAGDSVTADTLKIVINSSFGKFADRYSALHDPVLLPHVTLTGQLSILMLIESLEIVGISVVSANTDGLMVKYRRSQEDQLNEIIAEWQERVNFNLERVEYAGVFSRDVNNYVAVGIDGKVKMKGAYGPASLKKNPQNDVCAEAVVHRICTGKPISEHIRVCSDVRKFLSLRKVEGGAKHGAEYLGRVVRWYHAKGPGAGNITYASNGNRVPETDGVRPLMKLPGEMPADLDYNWYIKEAESMLADLGVTEVMQCLR